jgi:hypothetical protein
MLLEDENKSSSHKIVLFSHCEIMHVLIELFFHKEVSAGEFVLKITT